MWSVGDRCWSWLWERFLSNKFSLNRHCGKVKDVKVCHFETFKFPCSPRMGLWGFKVGLSHCERHPEITRIHVILQVWLDDINAIHYWFWYWSGHLPDMLADLVSLSERRQLRQLRPFHSHEFPQEIGWVMWPFSAARKAPRIGMSWDRIFSHILYYELVNFQWWCFSPLNGEPYNILGSPPETFAITENYFDP